MADKRTLPETQEVSTALSCSSPSSLSESSFVKTPFSILIVDDLPSIRWVLGIGLEGLGYNCQEAQHGLEALRRLTSQHFDVVLTDFCMPFLDGLGLIQHIYLDPNLGNPMMIMMTGSDTATIAPLALGLGCKGVLQKPCSPSEIDQIIRQPQTTIPKAA